VQKYGDGLKKRNFFQKILRYEEGLQSVYMRNPQAVWAQTSPDVGFLMILSHRTEKLQRRFCNQRFDAVWAVASEVALETRNLHNHLCENLKSYKE
jgi:hypothetical protein